MSLWQLEVLLLSLISATVRKYENYAVESMYWRFGFRAVGFYIYIVL